jgi:hypothetical protein
MKIVIHFKRAPSSDVWGTVLFQRGWKAIRNDNSGFRAKKQIGQSSISGRLSTRWYVSIEENDGIVVSVEVPAFAYSTYADRRLREFITEVTEAIDGECITDDDLTVDVLSSLRKKGE